MQYALRGALTGLATVALLGVPTAASAAQPVTDWELNEGPDATVMVDSSGNGLDGHIGSDVQTGASTPSGLGYTFSGPTSGQNPERLVTVADDPRLDPGTEAYAVTIRFRTFAAEPNIVQKGQAGQAGGFWKLVLKQGWPRCHFRDGNGNTKAIGFVNGPSSWKANDGQWHTVRCERLTNGVRVTLDYGDPDAVSKFIRGAIGRVDNSRPFAIGGKVNCAAADVGCDYFNGKIDWITVDRP